MGSTCVSVLLYVVTIELWIMATTRSLLLEQSRTGQALLLRLTYIGLASGLYTYYSREWIG